MNPSMPTARRSLTLAAMAALAAVPVPAALAANSAERAAARASASHGALERTSARLLAARTAVESAPDRDVHAALRAEERLMAAKSRLIDRTHALDAAAAAAAEALARRQAAAARRAAAAQSATAPSTTVSALTGTGGFGAPVLTPRPSDAFSSAGSATAVSAVSGSATEQGLPSSPLLAGSPVVAAPASGALAPQLDAYLQAKGSPLAGLGSSFVARASAVGLDPRLLVAIAGSETSFGTYGPSQRIHNPFGLGPHIVYPSWDAAIAAAARTLSGGNYLGAGRVTIAQIGPVWAPVGALNDPGNLNGNWVTTVGRIYAELGGDPSGSVFTGATAPVTGVATTTESGTALLTAQPAVGGTGLGAAAARDALAFQGVPYLWGGTTPRGFDCSGLVQYVYARLGIRLPRVADDQARVGLSVPSAQLQPGDAVFFADASGYVGHEGVYVGNGLFVHAPHTGDVVKVSSLSDPSYASRFAGARRYA
jgi:cell wall-associated NlpC family hydrolase